jgi:seryl-tRNA synthetase
MLDVFDFIVEKGGDPKKIKESQRRRYAPEEAVDEVIALYEDHRKSQTPPSTSQNYWTDHCVAQYQATQINTKINEVQKQIGVKRKAKEDADDLMKQKTEFEKEKKGLIELAAEKEATLKKKISTIGNIVHESVPVNNDEVFHTMRQLEHI